MRSILFAAALLVASACGGDDDGGTADADPGDTCDGAGDVAGAVGIPADALVTAWVHQYETGHAISLEEEEATCSTGSPGGGRLILDICRVELRTGAYDVVAPGPAGCPDTDVAIAVVQDGDGQIVAES